MEKQEWETIEEEIFELEAELEELEEEMLHAGSDYEEISKLNNRQELAEKQLEEKMKRWEYLGQYV